MAIDPFVPEIVHTDSSRVRCDGATEMNQVRLAPQAAVRSGGPDDPGSSPALGHPRVWLQIDEKGYVDCGYCDRRFILRGGLADTGPDERTDPGAGENSDGSLPSESGA